MRLYLDTNVLAPLVLKKSGEIDPDTWELLSDTENLLYASPLCVHELIFHFQSGRITPGKDWRRNSSLFLRLEELGIQLVPITLAHLQVEEQLPLFDYGGDRHRDPVDRLIVAQAISDKAILVSSDLRFPLYIPNGLALHHSQHQQEQNRRSRRR